MAKHSGVFSPDKDAGWGLIYRLNNLWGQVDPKAVSGDYDGWNYVLDRIYCNLLYRNDMIIERGYKCLECGYAFKTVEVKKECPKCIKTSVKGSKVVLMEILSIKLSKEDELIYKKLSGDVKDAKNDKIKAIKNIGKKDYKGPGLEEAKENHYWSLMIKDIWLRKFMQELKLYLKEVERDPSKALFG